ncbi:uncharacterized protein LOC108030974 [Drosophila biarmipes]|uniref:uncharacterized protein LOC108030974 n=1 Tax=Drosophila biarmipes TaxID=125945 RepID=UPI0007E5C430|nr:uncharacterized protein LOC108030974 [Drosophila biarmipes]
MSLLRCLLFLIFGTLLLKNAVSQDTKSQDEVKNESVERIRRQIGAFGYGVGVFGGRQLAPLGNPLYGGTFGNPYLAQPYGHYFHDRRFGGNYGGGFGGNFYGC